MNAISGDDARARADGRRVVHAIVVTIAVVFIGASAAQIVPAVFGAQVQPLQPLPSTAATRADSPERACAEGIRSLLFGLNHAEVESWRDGFLPGWEEAAHFEGQCAKSREGLDAWAALLRLRRAEEEVVLRGLLELDPLRRDVAAHLPPDLR